MGMVPQEVRQEAAVGDGSEKNAAVRVKNAREMEQREHIVDFFFFFWSRGDTGDSAFG